MHMKSFWFWVGVLVFTANFLVAEEKEASDSPNVLKELDAKPTIPAKTGAPTGHVAKVHAPSTNAVGKTEAPPPSVPATVTNLVTNAGETPVKATRTPLKPLDVKGKIDKIDAGAGTLTVEGKTFIFTAKGHVYVDNVRKSLSDLKAGDLVAVTYWEKADGSLKATQIVKGYPRKKKKKNSQPVAN